MGMLRFAQIVTANGLLDGNTVYLDAACQWTTDFNSACVCATGERAEEMLGNALSDPSAVVGPRLIELDYDTRGVSGPRDFRERARLRGPSVGPAHRHRIGE